MQYETSRSSTERQVSSAEAVVRGIGPDGGLYTPVELPHLDQHDLLELEGQPYVRRAYTVLAPFFDDFPEQILLKAIETAYGRDRFSDPDVAPLRYLSESEAVLELWHGPTSAFKDVALQLLPLLMSKAAELTAEERKIVILVATSGDTGSAALEGFSDVPGTEIVVFYPSEGVSSIQRLQMTTQEGRNVNVFGVVGDFDDAQSGVKRLFTDLGFTSEMRASGRVFSSANSINWGRLAPQIAYYVSAYCDAVASGKLRRGDKVNFVVPSGNFGNILAGYYALRIGLPVNRLICASNANNVLTDFFATGVYDRRRPLYRTSSPSMDILVSSNLERLIFEASGHDHDLVGSLMADLHERGFYRIDEAMLNRLREVFWAGWCDEETVVDTVRDVWENHSYLLDPHTAVGKAVYDQYQAATRDDTFSIILSTASPFKFPRTVLTAIAGDGNMEGRSDIELLQLLERLTGQPIPEQLALVLSQPERHLRVVEPSEMAEAVRSTFRAT